MYDFQILKTPRIGINYVVVAQKYFHEVVKTVDCPPRVRIMANENEHSDLTRRSVLRKSGIAAGALATGVGASAGSAAAGGKAGGVAYVTGVTPTALKDAKFRIGAKLPRTTLKHAASCNGHGKTKTYQGYEVLPPKKGKTAPVGVLYVEQHRHMPTNTKAVFRFHNADSCGTTTQAGATVPVVQANFGPARGAGGSTAPANAAGSAGAKAGGVAYVPGVTAANLNGTRFRIGKRLKATIKHSAACNGNGKVKTYQGYALLPPKKGKGPKAPATAMYVNPERNLPTNTKAVYRFHNADACAKGSKSGTAVSVVQANFGPTK